MSKERVVRRPLYLTAGNFPSCAANTLQVAKMAAAYTRWMPDLEVVGLTGPRPWWRAGSFDWRTYYGLSRPLKVRLLPLCLRQRTLLFGADHRAPAWFARFAGWYAVARRAGLVMTRKDRTALVTAMAGLPTILETHVPWEESPLLRSHPDVFLRPALRTLVVISEPLANSMRGAGVPAEKILVEPDGVDLGQYTPAIDRAIARRQLGLPRESALCVYCGHLHEGRGVGEILQAAAQLPAVQFLFVGGWDRDVTRFREQSQRTGLTNVTFTGFVPNARVPAYLFAADVLLMPYNSHLVTAARCSPLKMFEYLAAGRPIVSSDLPILRTVLQSDANALLIPPDSGDALAAAVRAILASPTLAERLGAAARRTSLRFGWDERAQRILAHATREG